MKKTIILILAIVSMAFCSCKKEESNPLVGTIWSHVSYAPFEVTTLEFTSSTKVRMSITDGTDTENVDIDYIYDAPYITLINSNGAEIKGNVQTTTITFKGLGHNGGDMVFQKV